MPYIKQEDRAYLRDITSEFHKADINNPGELNYLISKICKRYLDAKKHQGNSYEANYQAFNDVLGALEGAKLELYRRRLAPYEDNKILENGDI
jgi:hypothetical protein